MLPKIKEKPSKHQKKVTFQNPFNPAQNNATLSTHRKSKSTSSLQLLFSKPAEPVAVNLPVISLKVPEKTEKDTLSYEIRSYIDKNFKYPSSSTIPNPILYPGDYNYNSKEVVKRSLECEYQIDNSENGIFPLSFLSKLSDPEVLLPEESFELFYWKEVKSLGIESMEGATLAKVPTRLILFGGLNRQKHNEVYSFCMTTLECKVVPTLYAPKERSGHVSIGFKNKIIIYGGCGDYSYRSAQRRCDRKVSILSMKNLKWQVFEGKGHPPRARRNHAACRVGKFMICVGGIDKYSRTLSSCFAFNLKTHEWTPLLDAPFEVSHCSFSAVYPQSVIDSYNYEIYSIPAANSSASLLMKGCYLFGGLLADGKINGEVWVMNLASEKMWSQVEPRGRPPIPRFSHTAEVLKKYLIVFGGRNDAKYMQTRELVKEIAVLDLTSLTWVSVPTEGDVPQARWGHCSCVHENKMIVFGGIDYKKFMPSSIFYLIIEKSGNFK